MLPFSPGAPEDPGVPGRPGSPLGPKHEYKINLTGQKKKKNPFTSLYTLQYTTEDYLIEDAFDGSNSNMCTCLLYLGVLVVLAFHLAQGDQDLQ